MGFWRCATRNAVKPLFSHAFQGASAGIIRVAWPPGQRHALDVVDPVDPTTDHTQGVRHDGRAGVYRVHQTLRSWQGSRRGCGGDRWCCGVNWMIAAGGECGFWRHGKLAMLRLQRMTGCQRRVAACGAGWRAVE